MAAQMTVSLLTMGGLGLLLSAALALASRRLSVKEDPRIGEVASALPGFNCAACGFPSCHAYAELIVQGKAEVGGCVLAGQQTQTRIARLMNVRLENKESRVAVVCCRGGERECKKRFRYQGISTCRENNLLAGGEKACVYGCLGLGDCVRVCPFGAIELSDDELPVVNEEKCTGCGLCVKACVRDIIRLIPRSQKVYLGCVSQDKAKVVKDICPVGCFACGLCVNPKITPGGFIVMENSLPVIKAKDVKDWRVLDQAVAKCPAKCYVVRDKQQIWQIKKLP